MLSLSLIPYGFPVPDISPVSSTNTVNVGNHAIVEAGINNKTFIHVEPVTLSGESNLPPQTELLLLSATR